MRRSFLLLLLQAIVTAASEKDFVPSSPIIGILSQPYYPLENDTTPEYWIPSSYVKWLESAGARAMPIPYNASSEDVADIFKEINGVLFPGGASDLPPSARQIYSLATQANANGDFFPIWGTCLGFEYLVQLASCKQEPILESGFDAENISLPLFLWPSSTTRLYSDPTIRRIVSTEKVAMNNHHRGIEPERLLSSAHLSKVFSVSSANVDRRGRHFVSTIEPVQPETYPFYGVQYHPEKNVFEYNTVPGTNIPLEDINHSSDAVQVSLHLAQFFVNLTRHNHHVYSKVGEYPLVYSHHAKMTRKFEQVYVIPQDEEQDKHNKISQMSTRRSLRVEKRS